VLLLTIARKQLTDIPPGAGIAVVFEGGPKANTPQTEESRHAAPTSKPDINGVGNTPPGALPSPHLNAVAPMPRPRVEPQAQPRSIMPEAPRVREPAPRPSANAQRPIPHRAPTPFAALSAPRAFSLSGPPPAPESRGHLKRGIDMTMAPTDQNRNVMTRYAEARHALGEDWWGEFSKFVEDHKYYPLKAAMNGEDGQSVLKLVIDRDGTVRSVKVELSSGSPELDMAWVSVFRGNKVPAFPPGTNEKQITFSASMTYILEHM
jgi:protein TonB